MCVYKALPNMHLIHVCLEIHFSFNNNMKLECLFSLTSHIPMHVERNSLRGSFHVQHT